MVRIAPYQGPSEKEITDSLRAIKPGENVTYHTGENLERCSSYIKWTVDKLFREGRITLLRRRATLPYDSEGKVDFKKGVGTFEYIAQGRNIP